MNTNDLTSALARLFVAQVSPPASQHHKPPSAQGQPTAFEWAAVTTVAASGITVQVDGDSSPLPYQPDSLVDTTTLQVGDRLWCLNYGSYVVILGKSHGLYRGGWQAFPYGSGWADYGSPYNPAQFRLMGNGWVHLRGLVQATGSNASGSTIGTLPVGYRPGMQELFTQQSTPTPAAETVVYPDGTVKVFQATTAGQYVTLSGISFMLAGL